MSFAKSLSVVTAALLGIVTAAPIPVIPTTFTTVETLATPPMAGYTLLAGQSYSAAIALPNRYSVETPFTTLTYTGGQIIPSVVSAPPLTWTLAIDESGSTSIVAPHTTASIWTAA